MITTTAFADSTTSTDTTDDSYTVGDDTSVEDNTISATITVEVEDETVTVPDGAVSSALAKAEEAIGEVAEGEETPAVEVVIEVVASATQTTVEVILSTSSVSKVADAGATLKVDTGSTSVSLPATALTEIQTAAAEKNSTSVSVEIKSEKVESGAEGVAINIKISADETVGKLATKVPVTIPVKEGQEVTSGTVVMITDKVTGEKKPYVRSSLKEGDTSVDAMIASGSVVLTVEDNSVAFDDKEQWADSSIDFVSSRGIFNGAEKNKFDGGGDITTAQLFTVLFRLEDQPETKGVDGLSANNSWYAESAGWAMDAGLVDDVDNSTANEVLTRQALARMLWKYADQAGLDVNVDESDVPAELASLRGDNLKAMLWAYQNGIINGTDNGFDTAATTTRAQTATMIERMFDLF